MNRTLLSMLALLVCSGLLSCQPGTTTSSQGIAFTVLQVNDVYEIGPVESGTRGGLARLKTLKDSLKEINPNLIMVLSGDFVSPSLMGTLKRNNQRIAGEQMVDVLNHVGLDYVTFGNHEFDIKLKDLHRRIAESEFTWINTNLQQTDSIWFTQHGQPMPRTVVQPIVQGTDTVLVGWVGVCIDPGKPAKVRQLEVHESTRDVLPQLAGTQVKLALTHLERYQDSLFALAFPEFDLVLGGHDHDNMAVVIDGDTAVTKADANAKTAYVHQFTYFPATGNTTVHSTLVRIDDQLIPDAATQALVDQWDAIRDSILATDNFRVDDVLTVLTDTLDGRESEIRKVHNAFGTQVAQAMWAIDTTADLALVNSGSFRLDDRLFDTLRMLEILRTFPFEDKVGTVWLTGEQLANILHIGDEKRGSGGFLQRAGVSKKDGEYQIGGRSLEPARRYKVVVPQYLAENKSSNFPIPQGEKPTYPAILPTGVTRNHMALIVAQYYKNMD